MLLRIFAICCARVALFRATQTMPTMVGGTICFGRSCGALPGEEKFLALEPTRNFGESVLSGLRARP